MENFTEKVLVTFVQFSTYIGETTPGQFNMSSTHGTVHYALLNNQNLVLTL